MANQEHLEIFYKGTDIWNKWREKEIYIIPDLSGATIIDQTAWSANQEKLNLSRSNVKGTIFIHCDLSHGDLDYIQGEGMKAFKCRFVGTTFNSASMHKADLSESDLSGSILTKVDLSHARLKRSIFDNSKISESNLEYVSLEEAKLLYCKLSNVNLEHASLERADLYRCAIESVNLSNTNLIDTNLNSATLISTDLTRAVLKRTILKKARLVRIKLCYADIQDISIHEAHFEWVDFKGVPWLLIMELTLQPGAKWSNITFDKFTDI